ncbi:MAG: hypothetical protein ABNH21_14655 [Glaciecola sp.]|jgi:hypothetical protein
MGNDFNNLYFIKDKRNEQFQPYLFVETYFERKREMVIAIAFCEGQRRIKLSSRVEQMKFEVRQIIIGEICAVHYKASKKELPIFGSIQCYKYFYQPDKAWVFDVAGNFIETISEAEPDKATASEELEIT